jgi:2-amino-4-hydroxy-6-hydroxymethyldihydropteridine diphosphokinase
MSLIIATGTNQGHFKKNLALAKEILSKKFIFVKESQLYSSQAAGPTDQPAFLNQVLEFELPELNPTEVMSLLLEIEKNMGRKRLVYQGPRIIDLDLLFYGLTICDTEHVTVPHPRLFERSFVLRPLSELPYYEILKQHYKFSFNFQIDAHPI